MSTQAKHHYRAVFKSDHLGSADLEEMIEEGKKLVFTITHAKQFDENNQIKVAGKSIAANIVYFKEGIKPLVINSTNGKVISKFAGSKFVEDWNNIIVELYIDPTVKMKGQVVGGVRIKPTQPLIKKRDFDKEIIECKTVDNLSKLWSEMTENEQTSYKNSVTSQKTKLEKATV